MPVVLKSNFKSHVVYTIPKILFGIKQGKGNIEPNASVIWVAKFETLSRPLLKLKKRDIYDYRALLFRNIQEKVSDLYPFGLIAV